VFSHSYGRVFAKTKGENNFKKETFMGPNTPE
jgi:hypothetical protein